MNNYFGYVRVSTVRQGEHGVSLQEQREAISNYASRFGLRISDWFEEKETAAKLGRPIFAKMLQLLKRGKADGMIMHKIDRGARNLKDWADLGNLTDRGIKIHFANENLDLDSRGGRLSADIQAVVAADYIRNLREEVLKGFYGRLKQGLYPLPAPIGYANQGKGKPKTLDPITAPLLRKAFDLYASGRFSLDTIADEMDRLGLRNRRGNRLRSNHWSKIFNNPFYIGVVRLRGANQTFNGIHLPLISKALYDRVQNTLKGKMRHITKRHDFPFRRLIKCKRCGYSLIGEIQKGHAYYRCQTRSCPKTCIREERIEAEVLGLLAPLNFTEGEKEFFRSKALTLKTDWEDQRTASVNALELQIRQNEDRVNRVTDAYVDRLIEKDVFEQRKAALLMEGKELQEKLSLLKQESHKYPDHLTNFLELSGSAYLSYKMKLPEEKREFLKILTSNREAEGKNVYFKLSLPFEEVANRSKNTIGGPERETPRTITALLGKIMNWIITEQPSWLMDIGIMR